MEYRTNKHATWIDLESVRLTKSNKGKYHMIWGFYVESKKGSISELIYKTEIVAMKKINYGYQG